MSVLTILMVFVVAFAVTLIAGAGWGFALVYLPALLMLNQLPEFAIPHMPMTAHWAAIYGILLALPFRSEPLRLRWCSLDIIMLLLLVSITITAGTTGSFETCIAYFRMELLQWTLPYFMARILFRNIEYRRAALNSLIVLIGLTSVAALIEFRLTPYWYRHVLQAIGMHNHISHEAYSRFGFFRVSGTVDHPIYFGNMCVALLGMVAVLARTSGLKLKNGWVAAGLFGAFGCVITSISFTPYMGMIAGTVFFLTLIFIPVSRMLLVPAVILAIVAAVGITYHISQQPLGDRPPEGSELEGSAYIRRLIVVETWHKAEEAGPFGFGLEHDFRKDDNDGQVYDLESIDNSYMQFTMTRGWVYTALWLSIAVFFAWRMTVAFAKVNHPSQIFPLAVCTATVLGLMVSMYTVWAGGMYTVIWLMMLGLGNTLIDLVLHPELRQVEGNGAVAVAGHGGMMRPTGAAPALVGAGSRE